MTVRAAAVSARSLTLRTSAALAVAAWAFKAEVAVTTNARVQVRGSYPASKRQPTPAHTHADNGIPNRQLTGLP